MACFIVENQLVIQYLLVFIEFALFFIMDWNPVVDKLNTILRISRIELASLDYCGGYFQMDTVLV